MVQIDDVVCDKNKNSLQGVGVCYCDSWEDYAICVLRGEIYGEGYYWVNVGGIIYGRDSSDVWYMAKGLVSMSTTAFHEKI